MLRNKKFLYRERLRGWMRAGKKEQKNHLKILLQKVLLPPDTKMLHIGNSLAVQGLGLGAFTAGGQGSNPGRGTKIPKAAWCGQKKKKKRCSK